MPYRRHSSFCLPMLVALMIVIPTCVVSAAEGLNAVLDEDAGWELVGEGYEFTEGPAVDREGNVYFSDPKASRIYKASVEGKVTLFDENTANTNGLMFGPDGRLYGCRHGDEQIVAYTPDGKMEVVIEGVHTNDIAVSSTNHIYVTEREKNRLVHITPDRKVSTGAKGWLPNGVIFLPGEKTLVATNSNKPQLHVFQVAEDGSLSADGFYRPLKTPANRGIAGSDGMTVDTQGRLYLASYVGIQVYDADRKLVGVIEKPQHSFLSNVVFGGPEFDHLYATCADKVYRRKMKTKGAPNFLEKVER